MLLPPVYDLALPPSMMASEGEHTWALYTDADAMQITQDRSKEILASDFPFTEAELATLKPLWEAIQAASERGDADAVTAANQRVVNTVLDRRARVIVRVS